MTEIAPLPSAVPREVLKLSSPADVVAALPYLIGFQPEHSVVLLSLRGPRQRIGLTLRADLPPPQDVQDVSAELVEYLRRDGARSAIAVLYAPKPEAQAVWPAVEEALGRERIAVREALRIADGRWWSYLCTAPDCCSPGGTVILAPHEPGGPSRVAAELVNAGMMALGSRQELVDSVRAVDPGSQAAVDAELGPAAREAALRVAVPSGLAACRRQWQHRVRQVLAERGASHQCPLLTDRQVAELLIAIADIPTRDLAAEWSNGRGEVAREGARSLWLELTRRAPPPYDVAPATLLAHAAWSSGDGALARVAVERALASDPACRLAALIERVLDAGIDPSMARRGRNRPRRRPGR